MNLDISSWIKTSAGAMLIEKWEEALSFSTDENKKKITAILRKNKGSKWKLFQYGKDANDGLALMFYFDWKKDTQDWYEVEFKDCSEILETLDTKLTQLRAKHNMKVAEKQRERERERERGNK
ncbi:hypothetical protein OUE_0727 [Helicobacter pylori R030b]|nr:hypothetical protein OUE_0727 [Helicobacter pylori R030b]